MNYREQDLVRIAKRENNNRRNYLVVNPLQGKHIPASPSVSLELFTALADTFRQEYPGERLLLVGFAETATAIGAQAAVSLGTNYMQTTREVIPGAEYLFFSEEHSHASQQKLVKNELDNVVPDTDRIIFMEDEVTTGKTILNIISILERLYPERLSFSAASLLNSMSKEHLQVYEKRGIRLHYLVKTDHSAYSEQAGRFAGDGNYHDYRTELPEKDAAQSAGQAPGRRVLAVPGKMDPRRLVNAALYEEACERLWEAVRRSAGELSGQSILVAGTEEFMYPALFLGKKLEESGNRVLCHATTRSPIAVSREKEYPLHDRYELKSMYDRERKTFLYEIGAYDQVFVVTDAPEAETEGTDSLFRALGSKNDRITLIRWC